MAIEAARLYILVGAETGAAEAALKRTDIATTALGNASTAAAARAARLSDTLALQERQLGLLTNQLAQATAKHGAASEQVARKQLAIDRVTASMRANETQLARVMRQLAEEHAKLDASAKQWDLFGKIATGALHEIGSLGVQALLSAGQALKSLVGDAVSAYTAHERLGASYESLLAREQLRSGAAKEMGEALTQVSGKSEELLRWNQQLAVNSPFNEDGIAKTFRLAQAFGFVAETASTADVDAKRLTQTLVDYAAGSGQTSEVLDRVALALGQVQAKGKLAGQEVNQLAEAGIPVRDILAQAFGVSTAEIAKMQEKGELVAERVIPALVEALERDFGGAAARQSATVGGLLNSLDDLKDVGLREFFAGTFQAIQPLLKELVDTLSNPQTQADIRAWGETLGEGFRDAIAGARGFIDAARETYTAIEPVVGFIGDNAVPILGGLSAATLAHALMITGTQLPAIQLQIIALGNAARAATLAALPYAAIATAIYGVIRAEQEFNDKLKTGTEQLLANHQWWINGTDALNGYSAASKDTQAALGGEAAALREERAALEGKIEALARLKTTGRNDARYQQLYERETAAINVSIEALDQHTSTFRNNVAMLEAATPAYVTYTTNTTRAASATAGVTQQIQLNTEALEKLAQELKKIEDAGGKAFAALQRSTADFHESLSEQQQEHQANLEQIDTDAADKRADVERDYQQRVAELSSDGTSKRAALEQAHGEKLASIDRDATDKRADAERDYQQRVAELSSDGADKRAGLEREHGDRLAQISQDATEKRADVERDHQLKLGALIVESNDKRADLERDHADKLADLDADAASRRAEAERDYRQTLADLDSDALRAASDRASDHQRTLVDLQADTGRKLEAIAQDTADRIADLERDGARSVEDANRDHTDRLADVQEDGQEKEADLERDHARRLADLSRDLGAAKTNEQYAAVQQRIADEQEAYEQRRADLQTELQRQIADEQEAYDEKRAAIQRKLEREIDDARQAEQRKREEAQSALAQRLADEQAAYQLRQDEAARALERQRADAAAAYERQRSDLQATLDQQRADERAAYDRRFADLTVELAAQQAQEQASYGQRLSDADAALARLLERERASYGQRVTEADQALAKQAAAAQLKYDEQLAAIASHQTEALEQERSGYTARAADLERDLADRLSKEQASYAERQSELERALGEQRAAENAADTDARQRTAQAYAERQLEQRRALGEQLVAYVANLEEQQRITPEKAGAITAALTAEYGLQQTLAEQSFDGARAAIDLFAERSNVPLTAVIGHIRGVGEAGGEAQVKIQDLERDAVAALTRQFQDGALPLEDYIQRLNAIPQRVRTEVELSAVGDLADIIGRIVGTGDTGGIPISGQRARGGDTNANAAYLVGEEGPEIFLSRSSGTIIPNDALRGGGGGGSTIINVNLVVEGADDPRATAIAVREEFLRMRAQIGNLGFDD